MAAGVGASRGDGAVKLVGIVLAAGAGERMGGPKALLVIEGEPLARAHARRLREAGCAKVVIVTRAELGERFAGDGEVVTSGAPDPAGSLAIGLASLGDEERARGVFVVTPVDAWPASAETIARLVAAVEGGADAATPVFAGRGGHPIVIRGGALEGVGPGRTLRDALGALGERRKRVEVEDARVGADLDTPEDVVKATGEKPRFA